MLKFPVAAMGWFGFLCSYPHPTRILPLSWYVIISHNHPSPVWDRLERDAKPRYLFRDSVTIEYSNVIPLAVLDAIGRESARGHQDTLRIVLILQRAD